MVLAVPIESEIRPVGPELLGIKIMIIIIAAALSAEAYLLETIHVLLLLLLCYYYVIIILYYCSVVYFHFQGRYLVHFSMSTYLHFAHQKIFTCSIAN